MGGTQTFIYRDNTGGINLRANEARLNQGMDKTEFGLITNLEVYREGGFSLQKGNVQLNESVTDTTQILGIGQFEHSSGTRIIYTKASGKAYWLPLAGGAETEIKTGLDASAVPHFVEYYGKVVAFNGANTPWHWDGTTVADVTTPPAGWSSLKPSTACSIRGGRLLAAAGSTLYWNKQGDINNWTAANDAGFVLDPYGTGAAITALRSYGPAAAAHTDANKIFIFTGDSYSNYAVSPMASNRSAIGKLAVATINDLQYFFSGDRILPIITTDLGAVRLGKEYDLAAKLSPLFSGTIEDLQVYPLDRDTLNGSILLPYDLKNELIAYFRTQNSDYLDMAAIFNFDTGSWVFRQATPVTAAAIVGGNVITGTSDGKILQEFVGNTIVGGLTYSQTLTSPFFDFGAPHIKKRLLKHWVWYKSSANMTVTMRYKTNWNGDIIHEREIQLSDGGGSAAYGYGAYGEDSYSSFEVMFDSIEPATISGQSFCFEILTSDPAQDFKILMFGFDVEFTGSDKP